MKQRKVITVKIDGNYYGVFTSYMKAYNELKEQGFKLKSYRAEIRKLENAMSYKIIACERSKYFYTLEFVQASLNVPCIKLRNIYLN